MDMIVSYVRGSHHWFLLHHGGVGENQCTDCLVLRHLVKGDHSPGYSPRGRSVRLPAPARLRVWSAASATHARQGCRAGPYKQIPENLSRKGCAPIIGKPRGVTW